MADNIDENVSALRDGELLADEAQKTIDKIAGEDASLQCWRNYHLISDALRNNLPDNPSHDLATRISLALESEPSLELGPSLRPSTPNKVIPFPRVLRPAVGFAMAASVAAVAYVGLGLHSEAPVQPVTLPQVAATVPAAPATVPQNLSKVRGKQWDVQQPNVASKLNDYLVNHDEYSLSAGVRPGMLPNVRIVGYEQSEAALTLDAAAAVR